VKRDY